MATDERRSASTSDWYRPCPKCGLYPDDQHIAQADHPFAGDLPSHVPSGPWPCSRNCAALVGGVCSTPNRHPYPDGSS